jgi:hypothetical protein
MLAIIKLNDDNTKNNKVCDVAESSSYILKVEKRLMNDSGLRRGDPADFCLSAFLQAEPTSADEAYGKKLALRVFLAQSGDELICTTKDCEVTVDREDLQTPEGACKLASFCLKEAWDGRNNNDAKSNELYEVTTTTAEQLQDRHNSGFKCPNPLCEFSAGWSIDGIAGSSGCCASNLKG